MEIHIIYGSQFGSEAKRLFTEYYCDLWQPDVIITNAMPNSGGFDSAGVKWSALPIRYPAKMMLSPGSAIDLAALEKEKKQLPPGAEVIIHQNAAVVSKDHRENEKSFISIGSTMTGGMRAIVEKMSRNPDATVTAKYHIDGTVDNTQWLGHIKNADRVLVLCAQGHSLSINHGIYPYCTSRNTSPTQALADAGLPLWNVTKIIGCCRTAPIRVANHYGDNGDMIGYSGPTYSDSKELSWDNIGVPPEMTSISKKVRRVFSFSGEQMAESVIMNGTTDLFVSFLNYIPKDQQKEFVRVLGLLCKVSWVGLDKTISDIYRTEDYKWNRSWV